MLGSNIEPPKPTKIKKLGLTGSASSEFAKRFLTKPSRQPKVIDFSTGNLHGDKKRRGINGFFPPMKLRSSSRDLSAKSNMSTDTRVNVELSDQPLLIDVTKRGVASDGSEPLLSTNQSTQTDLSLGGDQLTHENIKKQFPKEINIPAVDRVTETDDTGSTKALDTTIQFKLPPVTIGDIGEHEERKVNTRSRCIACNTPDRTEESRNGWHIDRDQNVTEVQCEDFTNAILGHLASLNFRFRREWTVHLDQTLNTKRLHDILLIERMKSDLTVANKPNMDRYNVDVMKYMTREIYTNKKLANGPSRAKEDRLQLVPTSFSEVRPRSNTSRSNTSRGSRRSGLIRKTPESVRTAPPLRSETYTGPSETFDCDDLSFLPPPKRILPRRDVPWVFRYKVKRNMNELSKILASKPQAIENI